MLRDTAVESIARRIHQFCRVFPLDGSTIRILDTPTCFINELENLASSARDRVRIATLYIGDGELERKLADAIQSSPATRVSVLMDLHRGTRVGQNSTHMLSTRMPRGDVGLFDAAGWLGACGPRGRWKEVLGVMHAKYYMFDNSLLVSGANLGESYFTDRQDRYMCFDNAPHLCSMVDSMLDALHANCDVPSLLPLFHPQKNGDEPTLDELSQDTLVFPTLQMGSQGVNHDHEVIQELLEGLVELPNSTLVLTSGYLNPPSEYLNALLDPKGQATVRIVTGAPESSGFHTASQTGAGRIPAMYAHIVDELLDNGGDRLEVYQYIRKEWSFHQKGILWYSPDCEWLVTTIGSSNLGARSQLRDLESQLVVFTRNPELKQQLIDESERVLQHCERVHEPLRVADAFSRFMSSLLRGFL